MYFILFFLSFIKNSNVLFASNDIKIRHGHVFLEGEESLIKSLEPPSGGELKLLTHLSTENWAHNWLLYIANSGVEYNDNYYMDYFSMKGMSNMYTSPEFFYLGYFPDSRITTQGPKYVGLFELQYKKRIFNTKCIMENPYYMEDKSELLQFKDLVTQLTDNAHVFFNYKDLNKPGQIRYLLQWNFN